MIDEFRKNVGDHHELGWENMTKEYYESLEMMDDDEIKKFFKKCKVEFDNGYIRHSWYRGMSMIGRLLNGKSYIPFYMKESQIYDNPRERDNIHRVRPLIENIKNLNKVNIPVDEFTITQSGILTLIGIRQNDDVDIVISSDV